MKQPLKILLLEDDPTDADLIRQILLRSQMKCEFRHVMNKNEFVSSLDEFKPHVILSDNSMPQFNSTDALRMVRERHSNIPFILVTGTVSEEFATKMIKEGADDYILKDRMTRLPAAIGAALAQRRAIKEITDYKYALDQAAIVVITDSNGTIIYANDNFSKVSGYSIEELLGQDHRIVNSGYHPKSYMRDLWNTISSGKIWRGEFRNRAKNGNIYWVDATIVPFLNDGGQPYQYLSIRSDITEKKRLQEKLFRQQRNEQLKLTSTALQAEEKARTEIGRELHDNVNQILVGTKLYLSMINSDFEKNKSLVVECLQSIQSAIDENRKIAHNLVTPDFENRDLLMRIRELTEPMMYAMDIKLDFVTDDFNELLLNEQQKLTIYRIIQEQCTNIVKHAKAGFVRIKLQTTRQAFTLVISDNGVGLKHADQAEGIGLKNIRGRLSVFNGTYSIHSEPGKGFELIASFPLAAFDKN